LHLRTGLCACHDPFLYSMRPPTESVYQGQFESK
jgi:hypothetical protein